MCVIAGCRRQPSPTVFVDPALATLIPADTVFVAGVRVEQLQGTPVYQRYVSTGKLRLVENFTRETGIDVRKSVWEVVIPSDGNTTWTMLRGKFADMGMEPRVNREGAERLGYKGYTMLGDHRMAVLFLNPTTAVAAPPIGLRNIIDNRDTGTGMPARLNAQVNAIPATNQLWFAGRPPTWMPHQLLAHMKEMSGGADLRSGVKAQMQATAQSPASAQQLRTALFGFVSSSAGPIAECVTISVDDSVVKVTVDVPRSLLDDALAVLDRKR